MTMNCIESETILLYITVSAPSSRNPRFEGRSTHHLSSSLQLKF